MAPEGQQQIRQVPPQVPPSPQDSPDAPKRDTNAVLDAAASMGRGQNGELTPEESADALDWFLSDVDESELEHTFQINVGSVKNKRWIDWTVKPVDMDRLKQIRRASQQGSKRQRRMGNAGEFDEVAANVQIVLEGTVSPDLRAAAKQLGLVDAGEALRRRFAHKPGLLAQISGEIMDASGYDDDDVREVDAALG